MAGSLRRRGPGDGSVWSDAAAGFAMAHRHLSPSTASPANQSLVSSCGRYVLSSDGQIYNGGELIARLRAEGRRAPGLSDFEAITEGAATWGIVATLQRIEGEIAGSLWDRERRELHLFRDHFGAKPLYWAETADCFLFASELRALRSMPGFDAELDRNVVASYLRSRAVPAPYTIYRGARSMAPGTILTLPADGSPQISAYWTLEEAARRGAANVLDTSDEEAIDRFDKVIRASVRKRVDRLRAGVMLSGGFDSALVAGVARDLGQGPLKTFTVGFQQKALNEAGFARDIARHIGSDHHAIEVDASRARDIIPELPEIFDEPNADISQIPSLLVLRLARGQVDTILTGDGAAESFGGSLGSWRAANLHARIETVPLALRRIAKTGIELVPARAWTVLSWLLPNHRRPPHFGDKMHRLASVLTLDADQLIFSFKSHWQNPNAIVIGGREPPNVVGDPRLRSIIPDLFDRAHYFHTKLITSDVVLTKGDRVAAAAGIDIRFPFADPRLAEFGWSLAQKFRLRGLASKWIVRQGAYRYVPRELLNRQKMSFDLPMGEWLLGPLRDWAEDLLDEARLKREGIFDPRPIRARWQAHLNGHRNWQGPLWVVLMFQAWKQRWQPAA